MKDVENGVGGGENENPLQMLFKNAVTFTPLQASLKIMLWGALIFQV